MLLFLLMRIEGLYRKIAVVLLLAAFTTITFNQSFITLDYFLQRDFIANTLCINKAKPQMHCNGKCQLMKKLQQEQKKDQENPLRKTDTKKQVFYFSSSIPGCSLKGNNLMKSYPLLSVKKAIDITCLLLRPPDCS